MFSQPRSAVQVLVCLLLAGVLATPAVAQNGGGGGDDLSALKQAYSEGMKAAKQNDHETAYPRLEEAYRLAEASDQSNAARQILSVLQQLPKQWGNQALKNKNYSAALMHFEKGSEHAPEDAYMMYGQGVALVNMDSTGTAMARMSQAIEVGQANGDTRTANLATERIREEYIARASQALSAQNPSEDEAEEALTALDQMREYVDPSAKSLFYRSLAYDVQGDHEQAIQTAERGLEMHQGSRSDAARYHFVIAESQMRMGNTNQACQTFQDAAYGDYKARSEHYLENQCE